MGKVTVSIGHVMVILSSSLPSTGGEVETERCRRATEEWSMLHRTLVWLPWEREDMKEKQLQPPCGTGIGHPTLLRLPQQKQRQHVM